MRIASKVKDYTLEMAEDVLGRREELLAPWAKARKHFFVDENVLSVYRDHIEAFVGDDSITVIPARETRKSYEGLTEYYSALIDSGFRRSDLLVTFGGGILQDISGFIASTLYRGVPWVFFPTTLLAQADSCIGSKTSINFGDAKNLLGTFYPPDAIFVDASFCTTLADEYFNSGLGEIIKFHLMSDERGYDLLKRYLASPDLRTSPLFEGIVLSTLEIKRSYFEGDEFDSGRRNLLNYGHCFGHALESASAFGVSHGEAVIVGMGVADLVSLRRGIVSPETYEEFEAVLRPHYPRFDLAAISASEIVRYLKKDKKRASEQLTMILSRGVGDQLKVDDLTEEEFISAYEEFLKVFPGKEGV